LGVILLECTTLQELSPKQPGFRLQGIFGLGQQLKKVKKSSKGELGVFLLDLINYCLSNRI